MGGKEIGRIGQKRYQGVFFEEFVPELVGKRGAEVYKEMSNNDDVCGAILFAMEMLMRQCDFNVSPGGKTEADKQAAQFVEECLNDMEYTWTDTVSEILTFLSYGWSYHEIVYKIRNGRKKHKGFSSKYNDGLIGWKKLPIRSQDTLFQWRYDENTDDLIGMVQSPPPNFEQFFIPIEKALHFTTKSVKANPEGKSIFRNAYRSWYFKKRIQEIEGIGIERDLAGFPLLEAPESYERLWDPNDQEMVMTLQNATAIVSGIRRDEREGLVLPPGWKLTLVSTGSRRQFDTNQIIERYDKRMATTVLADFIFMGQQAVGSFALSDNKTQLFSMAVGTYLDIICEVFNNQAIPRLIDINGDHFNGITDYPTLEHGDIEETDIEMFATFLEKMIGAGVLIPDEEIEDEVRRVGGLPERQDGAKRDYTQQPEQKDGEDVKDQETAYDNAEAQSIYKIISILEKYQKGSISRNIAESMLDKIGCDEEETAKYLSDADSQKEVMQREAAAKEQRKQGNKQQEETPQSEEDIEDEKAAEEAKKSLRRFKKH